MRRALRVTGVICAVLAVAFAGWLVTGGAASLAGAAVGVARGGYRAARSDRPLDALRPTPSFGRPPPSGSATGARVLRRLEGIERRTRRTRYRHRTRVDEAHGVYEWDCSGMAAWVLAREAPRARRALARPRPVARTFARRIRRAPTERSRRGWRRVPRVADTLPGDVFAWERPPDFPSRNSGHVGFVVNAPVQLADDLWAVRILDSTSLPHQDDTRSSAGEGGTGRGTMTFLTDPEGRAIAYGWYGTRSLGYVTTRVYFGRLR